jgi:TatA/E family protein of Tat protein translocase
MGIENPVHLLFIAAVALIVLGPKRLPGLAKALGHGIREFREAISQPSTQHVQPSAPNVQPVQHVPPSAPNVQPVQHVQPSAPNVQPPLQQVQPSAATPPEPGGQHQPPEDR